MQLVQLASITDATQLQSLSNAQATELQTALQQLGFLSGGIDGIVGPQTLAAWGAYKSSIGASDPGAIGPSSVQSLQQSLDAPPSPSGGNGNVPPAAVRIVKFYEGLRLNAYNDGVGVATIGWGTTKYPNGQRVQMGQTCTQAEAETYLQNDITQYMNQLASSIPTWGAMNDNQRAAIISFAYNLGAGFYGNSNFNTITRALSSTQNFGNVPDALKLYSDPGDPNVHAGLLARRIAEGQLFQGQGQFA